jgi:4-hydroxy-tetrahydrodipicolinate synthase
MFKGSFVALVTPFRNGGVDEKKLRELVDFQVANKTVGIVPCGTTGESSTLSHEEHNRVIDIVVDQAGGKTLVIAGTGSNSTDEAIELTRHAKEAGADAVLSIVPYYNKPTQNGMLEHFSAIAKNVRIPLITYNIPSRTGVNMLPQTLAALAKKHSNVVGVKESSGSLDQVTETVRELSFRKDFSILSGDDSLTLPMLSVGCHGVISVLANIAPTDTAALCDAFFRKDTKKAAALHAKMSPLIKALFIETNPAPVKTAMEILGLCSSEMRLPMCRITPESRKKLAAALKIYGLSK